MSTSSDLFLNNNPVSNQLAEETGLGKNIFFNGCFDKNQVKLLVSWFLSENGEKKTIDFLELLKNTGFHQATQAGISLGLDDLEIPPEKSSLVSKATAEMSIIEKQHSIGALTSVEKSTYLIDTWNQTSESLRQNAVQNFKNGNCVNPVYMMAFSGARGNISQVRQLVAMRGLMADPQGAILEFPIQSNFREGLTITEYLISCYGARKGLVDTALRTATSGYLTRRLVDSAQHAVVSMTDCNTTKGIYLTGKNLEDRLVGRVLAESITDSISTTFQKNHIITHKSAKTLSATRETFFIRSPLTCDSQTTICQMCYGWNLATGKVVTIGEAIGVIAAQSIGEPGTQLTMRTFHTGGVGVFSDQAMKPILAPYDGHVEFLENLSGHLVRTPHGTIRYMVKYISKNTDRILCTIRSSSPVEREFVIRESELPSGSLLVAKQGEYVKARQLLAQSSQLKLTKQTLPESSNPLYSPLQGEVFFESMHITIQKEIISKETEYGEEEFESNILRVMKKIGSFWILASHNQHEVHRTQCFARPGDLISPKTLFFQYNLYSFSQAQIKKINKKLGLGYFGFQIPILSTSFDTIAYRFQLKKAVPDVLMYKKIANSFFSEESIFWYPNGNLLNNSSKSPVYTYILPEYFRAEGDKNESNEFLSTSPLGSVCHDVAGIFFLLKNDIDFTSKTIPNFASLKNTIAFSSNLKNSTNSVTSAAYVYSSTPEHQKNNLSLLLQIKNYKQHSRTLFFGSQWLKNPKSNHSVKNKSFREIGQHGLVSRIFYKRSQPVTQLTQQKLGWLSLPTRGFEHSVGIENFFSEISKRKFLKNGSGIDTLAIPKKPVSLEYIPGESILKPKTITIYKQWYMPDLLLNSQSFTDTQYLMISTTQPPKLERRESSSCVVKPQVIYRRKSNKNREIVGYWKKSSNKKQMPLFFFHCQSLQEYILLDKMQVCARWAGLNQPTVSKNTRNPLFSKQFCTKFSLTQPKIINFGSTLPHTSNWFFQNNLLKITFQTPPESFFSLEKNNVHSSPLNTYLGHKFSIFAYQYVTFQKSRNFLFQTFFDTWVTPSIAFTKGYIRSTQIGELQQIDSKPNGTTINILQKEDVRTINLQRTRFSTRKFNVGSVIRIGDELVPNSTITINGQVIKWNAQNITIRVGRPFLASARGLVHIFQNELVKKGQLLVTLKSRRLQTEDIVQGIPKIEQLFEARESQSGQILQDTVHSRLRTFFLEELGKIENEHWSIAVEKSFIHAQHFLVDGIIEAYGNQGVRISEKHVEVVVRQMTNRVRILTGGDTGLLPGELVEHRWIQHFNQQFRENGLSEARYEPLVLGISKSVLQSESFLLAASFQEVSRVLVKSALSKKQDFLRGLHENVIVGQFIPAGTGLISQMHPTTSRFESFSGNSLASSSFAMSSTNSLDF